MEKGLVVEQYLDRVAQGETSLRSVLLSHLADTVVYLPAIILENVGDKRGTSKIKVVTFTSRGNKIVPAFTSEDYFFEWSGERYQIFSAVGGDLALALPKDVWLVLNPGLMHSLEISPQEIVALSEQEPAALSTQSVQSLTSDNESAYTGDDKYLEQDYDALSTIAGPAPHIIAPEEDGAPTIEERVSSNTSSAPPVEVEQLTAELSRVFASFSEIEEAYFQELPDDFGQVVLGLLSTNLDVERRFVLIDGIADVSRKYYGAAGVIEVYDDLNVTTSNSWDLFNAIAPFYVKNSFAEQTDQAALETKPDIFRIGNDSSPGHFGEDGESEDLRANSSGGYRARGAASKAAKRIFRRAFPR